MCDDEETHEGGGDPPAPTIHVSGLIGVVSPFNGNQEEWVEYAERLDYYFTANDITDVAKRRATLLNGVGPSTYRLIKTLSLSGTPKDHTFEELIKRATSHFNPKPSPIIKRYEFNTRVQKEWETVAQFAVYTKTYTLPENR